ncbi:MAG: phosphopantetheine-binding protein [Betaproteobacteria bacterium]
MIGPDSQIGLGMPPDGQIQPQQRATMSEWEREIAMLIIETLGLDIEPGGMVPDAPLYDGDLGLDSIDMLEIATVVSQRYGVEIRSGDAKNEKIFASLRALADHVARNRSP